jgi:DNA (cytosine-5)-methyltransferase 1
MTEKISMIELFSGIGAQERALRQLGLQYEVKHTCDLDANAVLSYTAMRWDLEKEMEAFDFPSQKQMIEELQSKNVGYDFQKGKHGITSRTPIDKLKQYYIADKLSKNLGDISKVAILPYADIVTYSFPCTDLSVAGKGEGMVNKCDACGHSWPIDFSNAEEALVCPKCGADVSSSTRSGLLGQVQRLLDVAKTENTLPKYLLLENVKNLVGKKFIGQFTAWVKWLDSIGYNTYWQVLNAKHYGTPQNRERVFAISIRKDVDTNGFTFPEQIPLTTRLKDVLETAVDEKYYLPDERIDKILNSTFMQEKKRIQMTDVCDTLLARDWKDPKCVPVADEPEVRQIGNVCPTKTRDNPNQGRVYDTEGIAPTLTKMDGGNREPMIVDEIKVVGNYMPSNHDASRVVDIDGIAPTVKENHVTVTAIAEPFVVASRGRNPENPSDRTTGAPTEQRLEPNFSGCTNTITSVQKDNYVCEPQVLRAERTDYGKAIRKQYEAGEIEEKIGNMREMRPRTDGVSNTITTLLKDNYVIEPKEKKNAWTETQKKMITEDGNVKRYINSDVVDEFNVGDCADISFPNGYNKANRVFEGYVPAINGTTTQSSFIVKEPIVYDDYNSRISADQDAINTLTCNCGASAERNGVKIIEPQLEKVAIVEDQFPGSRDARIYDTYSPTLRQNCGGLKVAKGDDGYESSTPDVKELIAVDRIRWRIRKLTSKECWRLMGFSDSDHDRAANFVSASALYKQAGNSICTSCLVALFRSLLLGDSSSDYSQYLVRYDN